MFGICVVDSWKAYKHHTSTRHRHHNIELMEYVSILTKDMLGNRCSRTLNLPPDSFNLDRNSPKPAVGMVVNANPNPSVPPTEALTQDSSLDRATLSGYASLSRNENAAAALPEATHNLIRTQEMTTESTENLNEDTGEVTFKDVHRRKRGICVYCRAKTSFFCPNCRPPTKFSKFWVCGHDAPKGKVCQLKHEQEWVADLGDN